MSIQMAGNATEPRLAEKQKESQVNYIVTYVITFSSLNLSLKIQPNIPLLCDFSPNNALLQKQYLMSSNGWLRHFFKGELVRITHDDNLFHV